MNLNSKSRRWILFVDSRLFLMWSLSDSASSSSTTGRSLRVGGWKEADLARVEIDFSSIAFAATGSEGLAESNCGIAMSINFIRPLYLVSDMDACNSGRFPEMRVRVNCVTFGTMHISSTKSTLIRSTMWKFLDSTSEVSWALVASTPGPIRSWVESSLMRKRS